MIVQEQHQYAYGSPLIGLNYAVGNRNYRHGYQGLFSEKDSETGWNSFELRLYNDRIGRWMSFDPQGQYASPYIAMGNNPVINVDPDGGWDWGQIKKFLGIAAEGSAKSPITSYALKKVGGTVASKVTKSAFRAGLSAGRVAAQDATAPLHYDKRTVAHQPYQYVPQTIGATPTDNRTEYEKAAGLGVDIAGVFEMGYGLYRGGAAIFDGLKAIRSLSSEFSTLTPKILKQIGPRGWTKSMVHELVNKPYTTRFAVNKATGNAATAYFNKAGAYVVRDNTTLEIIQVSNRLDPGWIPDKTIQMSNFYNPYIR